MANLLDTHFHLDYIQDLDQRHLFIERLLEKEIQLVGQTVLPSQFVKLHEWYQGVYQDHQDKLWISLGFHPWHIGNQAQIDKELSIFSQYMRQYHHIGEIGLDFSSKRLEITPKETQIQVFERILKMIQTHIHQERQSRPYLLSIHAVKSATVLMDILESLGAYSDQCVPIIHRFNGTSDELTRHIRLGGYFSIHPIMLTTKKGRAYIQQIPGNRILLESDLPQQPILDEALESPQVYQELYTQVKASIEESLQSISLLRGENTLKQVLSNQAQLFK